MYFQLPKTIKEFRITLIYDLENKTLIRKEK